jgi:hypothetical protein
MELIDEAPVRELRDFAKFVVDVLWGLGEGTSKASPRHLDSEKEWDCPGILSEISIEIHRSSFRPFPGSRSTP